MPDFLFRNTATNELRRISGPTPFDAGTVLSDGAWQVAVVSPWATQTLTLPLQAPARETHVFLIAGQSNAMSRVPFDGGADWPAGVFQYGRFAPNDGVLIPARRPLEHWSQPVAGGIGWALQFSIEYRAANPDIDLVLVPAALGGTGFSDNRWNPGDDLYADAVARVNALMAVRPEFSFRGILWHQGEADSFTAADAAAHQGALEAMIAAMRTDIAAAGPQTPFVAGGMVPALVAASADRQRVQANLESLGSRVAHTAHAASTGLSAIADGVHFNAAAMRVLGSRYLAGLAEAALNDTLPVQGWQISGQTIHSYEHVPAPQVTGTTVTEGT